VPDVPPELLNRVVERLKPEQVWLFGSRDLLVVLPDDAPDESLDWGTVWDAVVPGLRVPTDIVPVRRSEYAQMRRFAGSICRSVALEGVQVYGERVPPNPVSVLVGPLPQGDPWRARLETLSGLDRYATTSRYPGSSGPLPAAPDPADAERHVAALTDLLAAADAEDGIRR
jgi:hypothetical protein